jgi:hypothetical protein
MGIQTADSAGRRLKQCNILFAAAKSWLDSATMFLGIPFVETKDMNTASIQNFCLFIKGTWLLNMS